MLLIKKLSINGLENEIITDAKTPMLHLYTEGIPEQIQIQIYSKNRCLFDSGKQIYQSPYIPLNFSMKPKCSYRISVTVWKSDITDSANLTFETGFLGTEWRADWVEPIQMNGINEPLIHFYEIFQPWPEPKDDGKNLRPGQLIRKTFQLHKLPERARLYATAHGVYRFFLNGKKISPSRLSPEITPYNHYLFYQTFDLLPYLKSGKNELICELCDGWWIGRIGLSGDSCQYGSRLGLLAQLELDKRIIGTDESWECRESHIQYADLYIGEKWDLCKKPGPWKSCLKADYPKDNLIAQPIAAIRTITELPGRIQESSSGELIADFGQVISGVVHLEAELGEKTEIILDHSEALDSNGNLFKNIIGRNKQQRDRVITPFGPLVFEPGHTYHGFRYVRIRGVSKDRIKKISALVLGTPLTEEGSFFCSDQRLNQLQKNIVWSMRGNMVSIPTDCPQREKMGWTGDIQMFTRTGCFNTDLLPFLSSWLNGLRAEQLPNGEIPLISPNFPRADAMQREISGENNSAAWGDACILVPYYLHLCTGNTTVLKENLDMMERWLSFIAGAAAVKPADYETFSNDKKMRNTYLWQSGHHFGDWMIPSMSETPEEIAKSSALTGPVVASFFYAISLRAYVEILNTLIDENDTAKLRKKKAAAVKLLKNVQKAACKEYISPSGKVKGHLQGVYVLALYSGVVQGKQKQKVADRLATMIKKNKGRLDTGFVSTPYLLDVLYDNGHSDLAYQLLFSEDSPSWLYMVKMGASTIWENWQAIRTDGTITTASLNHYALGSVGDWIYRHIGGIDAAEPGYRKVRFMPDPACPISSSSCTKQTSFGLISCFWKKTKKGVRLELQTPVEAELILPGRKEKLKPGIHKKFFRTPFPS